jgi:hypothetical protein
VDLEEESVMGTGGKAMEEEDEFERKIGELAAQFERRGRRGRRRAAVGLGREGMYESEIMEGDSMLVDEDDE